MPNWCENTLYIKGKKADIGVFLESVRGGRDAEPTAFDFAKVIPYPEEFQRADNARSAWEEANKNIPWNERPPAPQDGYNQGGYQWCCANWGTKWNACDANAWMTTRGCTMRFNTAWSPPSAVIVKASELFPELSFRLKYWEGGAGYKGVLEVKGGHTLEQWDDNYIGHRGG